MLRTNSSRKSPLLCRLWYT